MYVLVGACTLCIRYLTDNGILVSISLVHSPNCSLNTTDFTEPILITLHHINSSYTQPSCGVLDENQGR